jgi:hypothetical protein
MSRTIDWEQWKVRRSALSHTAAQVSERLDASPRRGGGRVREPQDAAMITHMTSVEIARRADNRRLVRLGPREYELHLGRRLPTADRDPASDLPVSPRPHYG